MRHLSFLFLTLMLLLAPSVMAQNAPDGYYFSNYKVEMTVNSDNSFDVVETIDAVFTEERHGIKRFIPITPHVKRDVSEKQDGSVTEIKKYTCDVENVNVSENFQTDGSDCDLYCIRIGDADKYVIGPHQYVISYRLEYPWDRVKLSDLFFYSVLGTGNNCDVQKFSFNVKFAKEIPQASLDALQVFMGDLGNNKDYRSRVVTKATTTEISGAVSNLQPFQSVSLYIPLPEGYFSFSTWQVTVAWIFLALAVIALVIVFAKEFFRPAQVTKIMTVVPPVGLSSADVGTLFDCTVDDCDIISLIPYFASKGYISIDNTAEHPILKKLKPIPETAPSYQKTLFNGMFPGKQTVFDTGRKTDKDFGKVWFSTKDKLNKNFENKLDQLDSKLIWIYIIALMLASFAVCFATCVDGWFMGGATTVGFGIIAFVMVTMAITSSKGCLATLIYGSITGFVAACITLSFIVNGSDYYIPEEAIYSMLALLGIVSVYATQMTYMTPYRRQLMGEILGLEEFIRLSEEPQLRQLQADDEKYFYDILPFAVALGMSEVWAKKFDNIIVKPNENFIGKDNMLTSLMAANLSKAIATPAFASGIKAETKAREAAARAASSSGSSRSSSSSFSSGGGGFSGGGFGGGGSSSW